MLHTYLGRYPIDGDISLIYTVLVTVLLLIVASCLSAFEFALSLSHSTSFFSSEVREKLIKRYVKQCIDNFERVIQTCQLVMSACCLILGSFYVWELAALFYSILVPLFAPVIASGTLQDAVILPDIYWLSVLSFFVSLTLILLAYYIAVELVAKSIAFCFPLAVISLLAPYIYYLMRVTTPVTSLVFHMLEAVLRSFNVRPNVVSTRTALLEQLTSLAVQTGTEEPIDAQEEELIHRVCSFSDAIAREVMTPRTDIISLSVDDSLDEMVDMIVETGYSRFPVTGKNLDDVLGVVLAKEVLAAATRKYASSGELFNIRDVLREAYYIPGNKPVVDLLNDFKSRKLHIAIVLDEHGGVDGLVTLEDLLERIVGDILDESDDLEKLFEVDANGSISVDGSLPIQEVNDLCGLNLPKGDYDTLAGFIFTILGRMPEIYDAVLLGSDGQAIVLDRVADGNVDGNVNGNVNGNGNVNVPTIKDVIDKVTAVVYSMADQPSDESKKHILIVDKIAGHRIEKIRIISPPNQQQTTV